MFIYNLFLFQCNYSNKLCSKFKIKSSTINSATSKVFTTNWQNTTKYLQKNYLRESFRNFSSVHTQQPAGPIQEIQADPYIILDDDLKYVYDDIRHVSIEHYLLWTGKWVLSNIRNIDECRLFAEIVFQHQSERT